MKPKRVELVRRSLTTLTKRNELKSLVEANRVRASIQSQSQEWKGQLKNIAKLVQPRRNLDGNLQASVHVPKPSIEQNSRLRLPRSRASVFTLTPNSWNFFYRWPTSVRTTHYTKRGGSDLLIIGLSMLSLASAYTFWFTNSELVFLNKLGRTRLMSISWAAEEKLARRLRVDLSISGDDEFGPELSPSDVCRQEVENIVKRIIQSTEEDFPLLKGLLDWRVYVRENPEENAHCQIGGTLTVYTGMYDKLVLAKEDGLLENSRNALACIIAHEMAHAYCRHSTERIAWLPLEDVLWYILEDSNLVPALLNLVLDLPYSRMCETEADLVGLDLMARAGYNPQEAVRLYKLLDGIPEFLEFLSTHPSGKHRSDVVAAHLQEASALYEVNKTRFTKQSKPKETPTRVYGSFISWIMPGTRFQKDAQQLQAG